MFVCVRVVLFLLSPCYSCLLPPCYSCLLPLSRLISGSLLVRHVRPASVMVEPEWEKAMTLLWVKPEWGETHSCWEACRAGGGPEIGLAQRWLCTPTEISPPTTIVHLSPLPPWPHPIWKFYVRACKNCIVKTMYIPCNKLKLKYERKSPQY